jgi:predicted phosphate transport protein (TIGR00153 family)
MKLEKLLAFFIPKDKIFFTLFEKAANNLVDISTVFNELVNTPAADKRMDLVKKIEDLEHVGDSVTHEIFTALSTNFITPFDREDIQYLASSLDDIADYIDGSAKRLVLYKIDEYSQPMRQMAEIIFKSAVEIKAAVGELKSLENKLRIREALVRINSLENHADDIFDGAIANLFEEEKDAIKIIKLKEILSNMETATDKCEDVANVIETILIKNS